MFENFRDKCIEIYGLYPAYFVTAPGLARQACSKKTEIELELLSNYDMFLMVENGVRGLAGFAKHRIGILKQTINI